MNLSRFFLIFAVVLPAAALAQQAPSRSSQPSYKVGFVSTERVMREARAAVKVKEDLESEYKRREAEILKGPANEVDRRREALVEDMNQKRDDLLKDIVAKANAMIKRVAEEENLDAVFLEATYASPRIDITGKVIARLNAAP
ncbi:MAG TPA: OmpH family outer membrane protein [Burkholderiales bacterium]|jgi:outer membrane protein